MHNPPDKNIIVLVPVEGVRDSCPCPPWVNASLWPSTGPFRSTAINGHSQGQSAGIKRATSRVSNRQGLMINAEQLRSPARLYSRASRATDDNEV
jgi:hypothetical protein